MLNNFLCIYVYINLKAIQRDDVLHKKNSFKNTFIKYFAFLCIYTFWVFNKSNNSWPLHCVSWINSNLQMAAFI